MRSGDPGTTFGGLIEGITGTGNARYYNSFGFSGDSTIRVSISTGPGTSYSNKSVNVGNIKNVWMHLAITYDGNVIRWYRDGKYIEGSA